MSRPVKNFAQKSPPAPPVTGIPATLSPEPSRFVVWQQQIATELGRPLRELVTLRTKLLVRGVDWDYAGQRASYTVEAAEFMKRVVLDQPRAQNVALQRLDEHAFADRAIRKQQAVTILVCFKADYANSKIISAHKEGATPAPDKFIQVQSNRHFRKGMKVPARHISANTFELARPCPRFPGKW